MPTESEMGSIPQEVAAQFNRKVRLAQWLIFTTGPASYLGLVLLAAWASAYLPIGFVFFAAATVLLLPIVLIAMVCVFKKITGDPPS